MTCAKCEEDFPKRQMFEIAPLDPTSGDEFEYLCGDCNDEEEELYLERRSA